MKIIYIKDEQSVETNVYNIIYKQMYKIKIKDLKNIIKVERKDVQLINKNKIFLKVTNQSKIYYKLKIIKTV